MESQSSIPDCPLGKDYQRWFDISIEAALKKHDETRIDQKEKTLTNRQAASFMEWKVGANGQCTKLDRFTNRNYCEQRGYKPIKFYKIGRDRHFKEEDLIAFREQFIRN